MCLDVYNLLYTTVHSFVSHPASQIGALQWANVVTLEDLALAGLQHGRKSAGKSSTVRLGSHQLVIEQQVGRGAFASVYKVRAGISLHFAAICCLIVRELCMLHAECCHRSPR